MNRALDGQLTSHGVILSHGFNDVIPTFVRREGCAVPHKEQRASGSRLRHASSVHLSEKADLSGSVFSVRVGSHERYDDVIIFVPLVHVNSGDLNHSFGSKHLRMGFFGTS